MFSGDDVGGEDALLIFCHSYFVKLQIDSVLKSRMGWLGPKSSSLRRALHTHFLLSPSKFCGVFSESLSSLTDPIAANVGYVIGQSPSQKSQEFHRPASSSKVGLLDVGPAFFAAFDATSSKGVSSKSNPMQQRLICLGFTTCNQTSFCRDRARGFNQGMQSKRSFSRSIVKEVEQKRCWSCEETSTAAPFFVCSSCKAIQPSDHSIDYFQLLSVDSSYIQDSKVLEKNYKQLQKFLHPDLSSGKSEKEQGYSAEQSAQVIKAYYVLLDPLSRARYMLKLNGVDIDEEGTIQDPALLMEIMELREEVEEATDPLKLAEIKEQNKKKMSDCENALKEVFQTRDIMGAVPLVRRMTYFKKIIEEITKKQ